MARILIVDDDIDIIEASSVVLEIAGHEIVSACNIDDGIEAVQEKKPDLMILDVMMDEPDDGFTMAQKVRALGIKTPIIMLTSVASVTGLSFGMDDEMLPVDDFIQKPVDPAVLQEKVEALLN
jgi:DNA-binding response OmpR family regulator